MKRGYTVVRSSGSHGVWDLCGIRLEDPLYPVMLIQCKIVPTVAKAEALIRRFKANPPLQKSPHYVMILEVQVKGSKEVLSIEV